MNLSEFCEMLTKIDNKENVPPGASDSSSEQNAQQKEQPVPYPWGWLRQQVPFIQNTIIKFATNRTLVNSNFGKSMATPTSLNMIMLILSLQRSHSTKQCF